MVHILNLKGIINLHKLCLTLQKIFYNSSIQKGSIHNNSDKCLTTENYNYTILIAALCLFNYDFIKEFRYFEEENRNSEEEINVEKYLRDYLLDLMEGSTNNDMNNLELKILANHVISKESGHWVAICKYKSDKKIYFYDSLRKEIEIFEDLNDFIENFNGDGYVFLIFKKFETTEYKNPVRVLFEKRNLKYNNVVIPSYYNNILKSAPKHEMHFLESTKKSEIPSLANINRMKVSTYEKEKAEYNKRIANNARKKSQNPRFIPEFKAAPPTKPITGWKGALTSLFR